jgi:alpha-tubulin suppressor-like RCC1 family protein
MRLQRHREITGILAFLTVIATALSGCGDVNFDPGAVGNTLASSVATGDSHTCAVVTGGKVLCWGLNTSGQLGDNTVLDALSPVQVSGITDAVQVSAGARHACARLSNGTVWCWGDNTEGQLGNSSFVDSRIPVQAQGISGAVSVAAGGSHTCVVNASGTAQCWGLNTSGQLGNATNNSSNVPVSVFGVTTASTIVAGGSHTCARFSDATISCWGSNILDQLGNTGLIAASRNTPIAVSGINTAISISAGTSHNCAEVAGAPSRVRCWGDNFSGQLARAWTPQIPPSPPLTSSPEALPIIGISTPTWVAAGFAHSCSVLADNTIRCWGENFDGQLGNGNFVGFVPPDPSASITSTIVPVTVSGIVSATQVAAGQFHTCSLLLNGSIMCWGDNSSGQLGDGTGIFSATPVQVALP